MRNILDDDDHGDEDEDEDDSSLCLQSAYREANVETPYRHISHRSTVSHRGGTQTSL